MHSSPGGGPAFERFDFSGFWDDHEYSVENYMEPAPSPELVASIEAELGYTLPAAYVELARLHNGGVVARSRYPMPERTG